MIKPDSKFFDDLARMAGGTVGLFNNLREDIKNDIKERIDALAGHQGLVTRDDFERLEARVRKLEEQLLAGSPAPKKASTQAKSAPKAKTKPASKPKASSKAKTAKPAKKAGTSKGKS